MSLVEKICEELGVEVGEIWEGSDGFKYCILSDGNIERYEGEILENYMTLNVVWKDIISGQLKPIWKPVKDEGYYYPRIDCGQGYAYTTWKGDLQDIYRFTNNLVFKTKKEAVEVADKMLKALKEDK